jgi:hypothetical protein
MSLLRTSLRRLPSVRLLSRSAGVSAAKAPRMAQVEVDEEHVKQKLGNIQVKLFDWALKICLIQDVLGFTYIVTIQQCHSTNRSIMSQSS